MLGVTEVFLFAVTFLLAFVILKWSIGGKQEGRYPPALPALPLVGSLPFLGKLEDLPDYFMKTAETLGPIISFYSGRKLAVVLNGKEAIVDALIKKSADFSDRAPAYTETHGVNVNSRGIVFAPFTESFKRYRKLSMSILKEFAFGVEDERMILEDVEEMLDKVKLENGKPFVMKLMLSAIVSRTAVGVLFGRRFLRTGNEHMDLVKNIEKHSLCICPIMDIVPLLRFLPAYRKKLTNDAESHVELQRCIAVGIKSALSEEENNFVKRFIQLEGPDYDKEQLFYLLRDFSHGAMDTTSATIRWAVLYLVNNPAVQDRAQKDVDSVIPRDRLPALDDKRNLPFIEAFILETMRHRTLAPFSLQHATSNDTELNGYFIPKGALVLVNLQSVHMDRKVWKDPEVFRPERFLDEENNVIGRERIVSFGLGKRACPGEVLARKALFLFITSLIQQFHIRPPEGHDSIVVTEVHSVNVQPSPYKVRLIKR